VNPLSAEDWTSSGRDPVLYVIDHPENYQKIGVSSNPSARLSSIQIGSPYELSIRTTITVSDPRITEGRVHTVLEAFHVRGEWHELPDTVLRRLDELDYLDPDSVGWQLLPYLETDELVNPKRAKLNAVDPDPGSGG
jgi:hypothetical protein